MLGQVALLAAATGQYPLVAPLVAPLDSNGDCCTILLAEPSLHGKVFMPESQEYAERLTDYYSVNAALAPTCMVLPMSTADVSIIAATIYENRCQFGMRSGGHSAHAGSNSVSQGVTVDFAYMNTTTYTDGADSVVIDVGATWGQVYETLDPFGKSVAGGRADPVGVGGFTTGGGYSYHASAAGWSCDTVRNFEIVLANGTVVNANAAENADLWRAQKGASGNFGFVTRVEFDIQPTNKIWGGFVAFPVSSVAAAFEAYIDIVDSMSEYPNSQQIMGIIGNEKPDAQYMASLSENTGLAEKAAFEPFYSVPGAFEIMVKDYTYAEIAPLVVSLTHLGWYSNWIVEMYASNTAMLSFINTAFLATVAKMRLAVPGRAFTFIAEFQPVTQSIVRHGALRGGNVLGLERVVADGPALMFMLSLTVESADTQDALLPLAFALNADVNAYADAAGHNRRWRYAPYAWGGQDPILDYGEENIALIKAAARRYDPLGVFQTLRASGFKIPAA